MHFADNLTEPFQEILMCDVGKTGTTPPTPAADESATEKAARSALNDVLTTGQHDGIPAHKSQSGGFTKISWHRTDTVEKNEKKK